MTLEKDSSHSARPDPSAPLKPPTAARGDKVHVLHGDERPDPYSWLRDLETTEVIDYLAAERAFYDASTARLAASAEALAKQMTARLAPEESEPSHPKKQFEYFHHTPPGGDYEQLRRRPLAASDDDLGADEVVFDPAKVLGDSAHIDIGLCLVSPDERLLAYSFDLTGDEVYVLRFRDLTTGEDLPDELSRTYYTGAWSADSASFFYTVHDEKYRPYQARRHLLGTSVDDDVLAYIEPDERYCVEIRGCRSGDVIEIVACSRDTTEVWLVDAHHPDHDPRCVEPRRRGLEYRIEHARTSAGDVLFIVTNDEAVDYRLVSAPLDSPGRHNWTEVIAETAGERLNEATAFAGHLVTTLRRDCRLHARAYPLRPDGSLGTGTDISAGILSGTLVLGDNELFDADHITVVEESHLRPKSWYDVNLRNGERTLRLTQDVPSYNAEDYVEELIWTTGDPAIPVTVVRRRDVPLDGTAPCLLYGYGAYEAVYDPEFDATLTVLLDQGVVFANAHIRGGGEGGRRWWLEGKLAYKQNTFSDHIAVANFLADGLVDGDRIVTRGLSAGGLLQGAVFSQAPQRWAGVIAEVPFVDVVTTMLDGSIPLTINEWDEWGDPSRADDYRWLRAYSPYDNLPTPGTRPDLLVTGALHDPRVMVWEPAKWVAALRSSDPQWSWRCLFRVEMGAGAHVGPSGRSGHVGYEAEIYAWALDHMSAGRRSNKSGPTHGTLGD